ncbi:type IV pilin protein [Thermodesulfobacteriota bacterium]
MRLKKYRNEFGFSLLEGLMVFVIIGALASVAIPQYASYQEDAHSVSCQANRRHIEMDEKNYYLDNDSVGLNIDGRYSCPSGGIYVWLISDPDDPEYPQTGCSVHFAGDVSPTSPADPGNSESPASPEEPADEKTPVQLIDDLIESVNNMDIPKKSIKKNLTKKLDTIKKEIEKDKGIGAIKNLDSFIKTVKKEKGKNIEADDADLLLSKAAGIVNVI